MAAFFEWNDSVSLEIPEIDDQHKQLVDLVNQLHEAMLSRQSQTILGAILSQLTDYTKTHFLTEEKYFIKFEYKKTAAHRREHQQFVSEVGQLKADFDAGKMMLSMKLMDFLKNWLVRHIQGSDREYVALFKANGLG